MARYSSTTVKSKWIKTKWMVRDNTLKKHIPETDLFRETALQRYVKRYKMIYFKPTFGTGGKRIARIDRVGTYQYKIKKDSKKTIVDSRKSLFRELNKFAGNRSYLLQKGIYLKKSGGRPFDLRVMVQKSKKSGWVTTAIVSKLGKPGKVATNYHQGGKVALLNETLRKAGYSKSETAAAREKLEQLGRSTGRCFDRHRKGFKELGLDVAIDKQGRYWILEVNTRPTVYPLKYLPNRKPYQKIVKYGKKYGRFA